MCLCLCLWQTPTDVEKCQDRAECFNADLKADWDRWQNNKRQDFRQLLTGTADKNIQYYEKVREGDRERKREKEREMERDRWREGRRRQRITRKNLPALY